MTLVTLQDLENSLKINQLLKSQNMSNTCNNDQQQQHLNFMLQNASVTKANLFTSAMMIQHLHNQNKSLIHQNLQNWSQISSTSCSSKTPSECGQQKNSAQINSGRYKTELCRQFIENGGCKYGDKCQFAHGSPDLKDVSRHPKYKTDYCRTFHSKGFCPYGPRCHFIHEFNEKFMESMQQGGGKKGVEQGRIQENNSNTQLEALQTRFQNNLQLNHLDDLNSSFLSSSSPPISPMPQPRTRSGMSSTSSLNSSVSSYDLSQSDRVFSSPTPLMRQSSTFNLPISKNLIQIGRSLITEKLSNPSHDQAALQQQIINIERLNDLLNSNQLNFCQTNNPRQATW